VELFDVVAKSIADTKDSLWPGFAPELILCATILMLLILRIINLQRILAPWLVTFVGSLVALYYAFPSTHVLGGGELVRQELFTGMLVYDSFSVYIRSLLLLFSLLFAVFTWLSGIPDQEDGADFYTLVLGATLGMCLMATANHLLMVFMAIEIASVPSYALAATLKGRRVASEAALKYSVYGAGAAGLMLYGISLLAGVLGTAHVPTLGIQLAAMLPNMAGPEKMVLALAGLMIAVGLAFKLSAVPFHFWCPDVFEGATAEVDSFLSISSKAAGLALVVRLSIGLGVVPTETTTPTADVASIHSAETGLLAVADEPTVVGDETKVDADEPKVDGDEPTVDGNTNHRVDHVGDNLSPVRNFTALLWACIAAITCTFGNLAAYAQTNMKRMLAYSTIAHAGYMLLPVPAALALVGYDNDAAGRAIGAIALYLGFYLFMNLGAFAIVAFLRNTLHSEEIADYGGLIKKHPGIVVCMAIVMFSLVGIPPMAGFVGKFAIFASLMEGFKITGQTYLAVLLVIGGLNTVLSLYYYLRVIKVMAIDPPPATDPAPWSMVSLGGAYIVFITAPLLLLFVFWNDLGNWAVAATRDLF
jgi:NADH-quinone oxidoreductase subunit N